MTRKMSKPQMVSYFAIAVGLLASQAPAADKGLLGSWTVNTGDVLITESTDTTDVFVNSSQAVVDWTPDDNDVGPTTPITFLDSNGTANFFGSGDFAILNRISVADANRQILLNGAINSSIGQAPGGSVFFYSPSGFLVGSNAVINVGSLVLSASPITVSDGQFIVNNQVQFGVAPDPFGNAVNPNAAITTETGSRLSSNGAGSYVALVAPQITHRGIIRTDGTAALVAAEAAQITFNPFGLFDIQVTTGTDAATGIHVDGGTIDRNNEGVSSDNIHRAYLVAVAKNDAVSMLINNGASVGFEIGTSASVEDNAVVISGGYRVQGGNQTTYNGVSEVPLTITNASLSSNVDIKVTGGVAINSGQGALTFGGDLQAIGGARTTTGGDVLIDGMNGNALTIGGDLIARGFRENADGSEIGLITRLGAQQGSVVTVGGSVRLDSFSQGFFSFDDGINGGNATGGKAQVIADAGSTIDIGQSLTLIADGYGGGSEFGNATGGIGIGGEASLLAINGGATINISGSVSGSAQGFGGNEGECQVCNITGGLGQGGTAEVRAHTGLTPNTIDIAGDLSLSAAGHGGAGDVAGGNGIGRVAHLGVADGSTVTVGADTEIDASGVGGYGFNSETGTGTGGAGIGGEARVATNAGTVDLTGPILVTANGLGGQGGRGGLGQGGRAFVHAFQGTIHARNGATVTALSDGGFGFTIGGGDGLSDAETTTTPGITEALLAAESGTLTLDGLTILSAAAAGGDGTELAGASGGNAIGGSARVIASGGTVHVTNNLFVDGGATGGDGATGGNATALTSTPPDEVEPIAGALYAVNNGLVDVDGIAVLSAEAVGGHGSNGNGGNAQGGEIDVVTFFGNITLGSLVLDVNGYGGDGGNGGGGGNAFGGVADVAFGLGEAAVGGIITLGSAAITADGEGGNGGAGVDGTTGGNGGAGGAGSGGNILFVGTAGGGTLNSGGATITALGRGGAGGAGGSGSSGPGGNGGTGGAGTGGAIQTGTLSADLAPTIGGGAGYTVLSLNASAFGGTGGDGGAGGAGTGAGGNGGNAVGGRAMFLARGVLVTADAVTLTANANGGNGGAGSAQGNGGNARTGVIAAESKDRFNHPDQRGTLLANSIVGSAAAVGGIGAANGTSTVTGNSFFRVLNGDATIGSVNFTFAGTAYDNSPVASLVSVRDGVATLGDFAFTTVGELMLDASNGSMAADSINLSAGTFVPYNLDPPQAGPGTYSADTFAITTGGNFITNAHLVSASSLDITAPGLIDMRNATSTGGGISIIAVGGITTGNLTATNSIDLDAGSNILFANVSADDFDFEAGGSVTGGNIVAGTTASGEAQGPINLGNINVGILQSGGATDDGFAVGFASANSINVLDVDADEAIGFATSGNLTTGDLSGGSLVMTLAGGNIITGSITTTQPNGQVYMADSSMFATGGGGPDSDFDASIVLALDPVMTGGSITINGPVSTSLFRAASGDNFTAGDLSAFGYFDDVLFVEGINIRAGGTAILNGSWAGEEVNVTSNDIDITSGGAIDAGDVALASTNAAGTIIGDGVPGSGYRLSDAEYDRINTTGEIEVGVNGSLGGTLNMMIGDLSVNAVAAGADEYEFATYQTDSEEGSGSIRVVGDMALTGMGGVDFSHDVGFTTGTFELDAATGSLSLTGSGTGLAGFLGIQAVHIHVAEGSILDQLAEDPQYEGYQADLNAPASAQRPDGVIRAANIGIDFDGAGEGELYTLYVQNTGTAETPAGFVIGNADLGEDVEGQGLPQSVDLIINGQIDTGEGILTGIDVRDALVADRDLTPFTVNSTINGCQLAGPCEIIVEPPFPPDFTPTPGIQDEITLIDDDVLPPPDFGNEDVIDDNDEETEDGATSPIEPPKPLFDTSELSDEGGAEGPTTVGTTMRSTPGLTEPGDVDDPVSGGGNPALMDSTTPKPNQENQQ